MKISWAKYVPIERRADYEKLGWVIDSEALSLTPHGQWSLIGIWPGEGYPPLPKDNGHANPDNAGCPTIE